MNDLLKLAFRVIKSELKLKGNVVRVPPCHHYIFLHVWWARRPLTPSRAAILGASIPADSDVDEFLKTLGIKENLRRDTGGAFGYF